MSNETTERPQEQYLPSLDELNDEEYLAQSREFGQQWVGFIGGGDPAEGAPELLTRTNIVLKERSEEFAQIPEEDRAEFLVAQSRDFDRQFYEARGQEPPATEPLTAELLIKSQARVIETRPGVPAFVHNDRYTKELFGHDGTNFAQAQMAETKGYIPAVVLNDTETIAPALFELNKAHETSHIAWRTAGKEGMVPATDYEDAAESGIFKIVVEEAICYTTAGQKTFVHPNNVSHMKEYGLNKMLSEYRELHDLYVGAVQVLDTKDFTLGIMQARNMGDLRAHLERMSAIARTMEPPSVVNQPVPASHDGAPQGWGSVSA